jgi:uncharacterized protein (TIGR02186 family)
MRNGIALAVILLTALLAARWTTAWADEEPGVVVSPETVNIGLNFSGADVTISGTTPEGADVVLVVNGPVDSVKMQKKGKVMGLFWMTVDQAEVEGMPAFHVVQSSKPIEHLLSIEQQVSLGVDPEASNILDQAQAVNPNDKTPLSGEKQTEFVTALRDVYITDGQYTPWRCYHEAEAADCDATAPTGAMVRPDAEGHWETALSLPSDAPLGEYSVEAHYVKGGQVVKSDSTTFSVEKAGMVNTLGIMAEDNAVLYGAMSLVIAVIMGLGIGFVFTRQGGH